MRATPSFEPMPLPELSPIQIEAIRSYTWLQSESDQDRRTGRSTAMALAFLWKAIRQSPRAVTIPPDHSGPTFQARCAFGAAIRRLAEEQLHLNVTFNPHSQTITVVRVPEEVRAWFQSICPEGEATPIESPIEQISFWERLTEESF